MWRSTRADMCGTSARDASRPRRAPPASSARRAGARFPGRASPYLRGGMGGGGPRRGSAGAGRRPRASGVRRVRGRALARAGGRRLSTRSRAPGIEKGRSVTKVSTPPASRPNVKVDGAAYFDGRSSLLEVSESKYFLSVSVRYATSLRRGNVPVLSRPRRPRRRRRRRGIPRARNRVRGGAAGRRGATPTPGSRHRNPVRRCRTTSRRRTCGGADDRGRGRR